jgi:DNA-binding NarL/FixJ family response regulator
VGGGYVTEYALEIIQRNLSFNENSSSLDLTELERKLLIALSKGKSSTEIGLLLCRSPRTIEDYRVNLYKKFGVASKEGLIKEATKMNLI